MADQKHQFRLFAVKEIKKSRRKLWDSELVFMRRVEHKLIEMEPFTKKDDQDLTALYERMTDPVRM